MFEEKVFKAQKKEKATKLSNHPPALKLYDSRSMFPMLILAPYIQQFGKYEDNPL